MKDFTGYADVLRDMAQARRDARDNAPRGSNDEIEAAMFLAMASAYSAWYATQHDPGAQAQTVPQTETGSAVDPPQPEEPEEFKEPEEPKDPEAPAPRRRR